MDYYVNELLCTLQCNYDNSMKENLISLFGDFYTEEEISNAKTMIIEIAEKQPNRIEEIKKIKNRTGAGASRARRELDDIFTIFEAIINKKLTISNIYAKDTNRIPSMKYLDLTKLASNIDEIRNKFNKKLDELNKNVANLLTKSLESQTNDIKIAIKEDHNDIKQAIMSSKYEQQTIRCHQDQLQITPNEPTGNISQGNISQWSTIVKRSTSSQP